MENGSGGDASAVDVDPLSVVRVTPKSHHRASSARAGPSAGAGTGAGTGAGAGAGAGGGTGADGAASGDDDDDGAGEYGLDTWAKSLETPRPTRGMRGVWVPHLRAVQLHKPKGGVTQSYGRTVGGALTLSCEEALYLLDSGSLQLAEAQSGKCMSFPVAYTTLLHHVFPPQYTAYATLRDAGYIVQRVGELDSDDDAAAAPATATGSKAGPLRVHFDVFAPRTYSKRNPGTPLFSVVAVDAQDKAFGVAQLDRLLADANASHIRAAVVDGATVMFYDFKPAGVPQLFS